MKVAKMSRENELSQEYAIAASGLAATACSNALSALSVIARDQSARDAMARIHRLGDFSRRAQENLEVGEDAYQSGHVDTANLEWASALVLMDAMSVEAANIVGDNLADYAADLQKSGKTA